NVDGSGEVQLTNAPGTNGFPNWGEVRRRGPTKKEKLLAIDLKRGTGRADPQVTAIVDRTTAAAPTLRPLVAWAAIVVLVVLAVIRSAVATRTDGFTIDDAYHITAGVSYVKLRDFRLKPEHPPLVKLWAGAALAPGFHLPPLPPLADKFAEREFNESVVFLANDTDQVRAWA